MKNITLLPIFALIFIILSAGFARAEDPRIYFYSNASQFSVGSEFRVEILADSERPANAVQIEIEFSSERLELVSLNTNNSVIHFWKEAGLTTAGGVRLEGGSIEPFSGKSQKIAALVFKVKKEGQIRITFGAANLYYADGLGTKISMIPAGASAVSPLPESIPEQDVIPPTISEARLVKSPLENVLIAIFQTEDNESGVRKTEARIWKLVSWTSWTSVSSPARVPDNALILSFRAIDNVGNVSREKTLYIWQRFVGWAIILLIIIICIIFLIVLWRHRIFKSFLKRYN